MLAELINLYNNIEITTGYNDEYQTITERDSVVKLILDNFNEIKEISDTTAFIDFISSLWEVAYFNNFVNAAADFTLLDWVMAFIVILINIAFFVFIVLKLY